MHRIAQTVLGLALLAAAAALLAGPSLTTTLPDGLGGILPQLLRVALAVGVAAAVVLAARSALTRRLTRRRQATDRLVEALARATRTAPEQMQVRVRRWAQGAPVAGWARYSALYDDDSPDARRQVETMLAHKIGVALDVTWTPHRDRLAWAPADPAATPLEPADDNEPAAAPAVTRDDVTARIQAGVEAALGSGADVRVTRWHGTRPGTVRVSYSAAARVHEDRVQDAVEDKIATLLPGHWRPERTTDDEVVFTDTPDPLAAPIASGPIPDTADLAALTLGMREDHRPWTVRLIGTHVLIGGASGSGKGSVLWSLVHALTPAVADGTVTLWAIDPKGGMELGRGRDVWDRFATDADDALDLLREAVSFMRRRAKRLAGARSRLHTPTPGDPLLVVVVDEIAALTKYLGDKRARDEIAQLVGLLLSQGRAAGVCIVGAVQDPRKEVLGLRDLFPTRIALRLVDKVQPDMVLGDGARAAGARADRIDATQPGTGYVMLDGEPTPHRFRAMWVDDPAIDSIAARVTAARRRPPAAGPEPAAAPRRVWDLTEGDRVVLDGADVVVVGLVESSDDPDRVEVEYQPADGGPVAVIDLDGTDTLTPVGQGDRGAPVADTGGGAG